MPALSNKDLASAGNRVSQALSYEIVFQTATFVGKWSTFCITLINSTDYGLERAKFGSV
jgi:hypothetical protein